MWICVSVCFFLPFAPYFKLHCSVLFCFWSVFLFSRKKNFFLACLVVRSDEGSRTYYYCQFFLPCTSAGHGLWPVPSTFAGNYLCGQMSSWVLPLSLLCLKANTLGGNSFVLHGEGNRTVLLTYFFLLSCKLHCLLGHICSAIIKNIESPRKDIFETQISGVILWINY